MKSDDYMMNFAPLFSRLLSPVVMTTVALSTLSTISHAGSMYIYESKTGQALLTNVSKPSGNFDQFTKQVKVTYYKDVSNYNNSASSSSNNCRNWC